MANRPTICLKIYEMAKWIMHITWFWQLVSLLIYLLIKKEKENKKIESLFCLVVKLIIYLPCIGVTLDMYRCGIYGD